MSINKKLYIIGCDIGGVVRDLQSGDVMEDAKESINEIIKIGHSIYFISKCKDAMEINIREWLKKEKLDNIPIFFCKEYGEKVTIGKQLKINMMIDDKTQVLSLFGNHIKKIWFCTEYQKISGVKKHQPDIFNSVKLVNSWNDIVEYINETDK